MRGAQLRAHKRCLVKSWCAHSRVLGSGGVNEGAASVVFEVQSGCMAGPGLSLRAWDSTGRGRASNDLRGRSSERELGAFASGPATMPGTMPRHFLHVADGIS